MGKRIGFPLLLALVSGFFGAQGSFAQQENKAALIAEQFLQAVAQGDSPTAFELCTSGLRRGKTAEDFLESREITTIFSGAKSWETIGVLGKGSIKTVVLKLTNTEGEGKKFRTLGIA